MGCGAGDKRRAAAASGSDRRRSGAIIGQRGCGLDRVRIREAKMVDAVAVASQPIRSGAVLVERLDQLDEDVPCVEVGKPNMRVGKLLLVDEREPEAFLEVGKRGYGVGNHDSDVIELMRSLLGQGLPAFRPRPS